MYGERLIKDLLDDKDADYCLIDTTEDIRAVLRDNGLKGIWRTLLVKFKGAIYEEVWGCKLKNFKDDTPAIRLK